jgi:molecular chaperone GrpE
MANQARDEQAALDAERTSAGAASSGSAARRPGDGARDVDQSGGSPPAESDAIEEDEATPEDAEADFEADLGALARERDDFRELAQRVQADFENYRKRMLREQTEKIERANESLIEQLLPVLDTFELALDNLADADEQVRKGVELVYADLLGVLEKAGLERIDALGKPFDPHEHEAVAQEDGAGEPVIFDILRSGYRLKDRVLRPATVRVTRAEG